MSGGNGFLPGTSFEELGANRPSRHRLIISIDGAERQGKTHLALTAPGVIGYMQMDVGGEDVLPKIKRLHPHKRILHSSYYVDVKPNMEREEVALKVALPIWKRTCTDYEQGLTKLRSLVIDTASEWFHCLRLARFGRLTQVMPEDYGPVYAEFRRYLRMPYEHDCNVIFLHKLKAEYDRSDDKTEGGKRKPGKKTGRMIRDGFSGLGYEVQIESVAFKEDGRFKLQIVNCRQNPDLDGMIVPDDFPWLDKDTGLDFAALAVLVYPETKREEWL